MLRGKGHALCALRSSGRPRTACTRSPILGFLAAVGYAASLPLQDRLVRSTDEAIQGQVLGLHMNGVMVWQAIGALIAGVVASWMPPAAAMATMAAVSTAVTLLLVPGLRRSAPARSPA
jgi:hypothetical protein